MIISQPIHASAIANFSTLSNYNNWFKENLARYNPVNKKWEQVVYAWPDTRYQRKLGKDPEMAFSTLDDIKDPKWVAVSESNVERITKEEAKELIEAANLGIDLKGDAVSISISSNNSFHRIATKLLNQSGSFEGKQMQNYFISKIIL